MGGVRVFFRHMWEWSEYLHVWVGISVGVGGSGKSAWSIGGSGSEW